MQGFDYDSLRHKDIFLSLTAQVRMRHLAEIYKPSRLKMKVPIDYCFQLNLRVEKSLTAEFRSLVLSGRKV